MTPQNVRFVVALAVFLLLLTVVFWRFAVANRSSASAGRDWDDILKRLKVLDRGSVALIARDLLEDGDTEELQQNSFLLEPEEIWPLIGGLEGLAVIEHNCEVLVELAFYLQRWYPEALVVAEELRLNAREIGWHMSRIRGASEAGHLQSAFPDYAQRAIAKYYVMTQTVLHLYETVQPAGYMQLQQSL